MKKILAMATAIAMLAGCATSSKDISASYTSPVQYQSYDCQQLSEENSRINTRLAELSGRLDSAANNDKVLVGVALVLFWPAALALGGTKAQEAEYARLKGESDAIRQSLITKKCGA